MGTSQSKIDLKKAVLRLTVNSEPVPIKDDNFWQCFWPDEPVTVQEYFSLMTGKDVRKIRDCGPTNLATLCYKCVDRIFQAVENNCVTYDEQQIVLNCVRLLTLVLPYIFESSDWNEFFWSDLSNSTFEFSNTLHLAETLLNCLFNLLFCPDFTVGSIRKSGPDGMENLKEIDSCEYIWEPGIGCAYTLVKVPQFEENRTDILKLILTCCSESIYCEKPISNRFIAYLTSEKNRHRLPLFTSLLNTVFAFDPIGYGLPYNYILNSDAADKLVEVALQLLIVSLDYDNLSSCDNLFINYLSRIYLEDDFQFVLKAIANLLNNQLVQTYLPHSVKRVHFHQELLIFFWKICNYNKKFMNHVLRSSLMLEIFVAILYHLDKSKLDQTKLGVIHVGVFILLLLSGERNFGVKLNKPYVATVPMDITVFNGTHGDLLILVFHKIITTGQQKVQPLYECLLTILANVSPYLKTLTMISSAKLLNLLEIFSTPWYLLSDRKHYRLVVFLLEIFNNLVQYQFDGNVNLVYTIIKKRKIFQALSTLSLDVANHVELDNKFLHDNDTHATMNLDSNLMKTTLAKMPHLTEMTEEENTNLKKLDCGDASFQNRCQLNCDPFTEESLQNSDNVDAGSWVPTAEWVQCLKSKLPLQTVMRLLQVLVPQIEKICGKSNGLLSSLETETLRFLQQGTLVGLLPVPHPILIRKYQANASTTNWFQTYTWGVIYLRNLDPPIWYDTKVKLFEIEKI